MIRRNEDVKPEPLRLNHSAIGGFATPVVGPEAEAVMRAGGAVPGAPEPEPLRAVDPAGPAATEIKPGSKLG